MHTSLTTHCATRVEVFDTVNDKVPYTLRSIVITSATDKITVDVYAELGGALDQEIRALFAAEQAEQVAA